MSGFTESLASDAAKELKLCKKQARLFFIYVLFYIATVTRVNGSDSEFNIAAINKSTVSCSTVETRK
jgi:hypothetical protein